MVDIENLTEKIDDWFKQPTSLIVIFVIYCVEIVLCIVGFIFHIIGLDEGLGASVLGIIEMCFYLILSTIAACLCFVTYRKIKTTGNQWVQLKYCKFLLMVSVILLLLFGFLNLVSLVASVFVNVFEVFLPGETGTDYGVFMLIIFAGVYCFGLLVNCYCVLNIFMIFNGIRSGTVKGAIAVRGGKHLDDSLQKMEENVK